MEAKDRRSQRRKSWLFLKEEQVKPQRALVALIVSDIHLSHNPPACRITEEDWYETQKKYLQEISELQQKNDVPVLIPGDVFDRWNSPAELINLALTYFPKRAYGVPGQHDLPNHNYQDIKKSAYWSLVKGDKLTNVEPGFPVYVEGAQPLRLWGFPWGREIQPLVEPHTLYLEIALVHQYLWSESKKETRYKDAPESFGLSNFRKKINGYDAVFVGDNHVPFISTKKTPIIVNCGSLMRRNVDQIDYRPRIWLYYSDNTIEKHYLDISKDRLTETREQEFDSVNSEELSTLIQELKESKASLLSFEEAIQKYLKTKDVDDKTRRVILESLG